MYPCFPLSGPVSISTVHQFLSWTIESMYPCFPLSGPVSISTLSPLNHIQSVSLMGSTQGTTTVLSLTTLLPPGPCLAMYPWVQGLSRLWYLGTKLLHLGAYLG